MNYSFLFPKSLHSKCLLFVIALTPFVLTSKATPQDNNEKTSKLPVSIRMSYIKADNTKNLKVIITRKVKRKNVQVNGITLSLYFNEISNNSLIGKIVTNENGEGLFNIPDKFYRISPRLKENTLKVRIYNDTLYEDTEAEIKIKEASLSLSFMEKDSIKKLTAKLLGIVGDTIEVPIPATEIKFYVKTTFSLLPIGGESNTNEDGMATTELPLDLPADYQKTMTVVARIEDHESYGTLETNLVIPWSVLPKTETITTRTLYSSARNAPLPLIIASMSIIIVVWSVVLYLIFQLFKVWKLGNPPQ